MLTQTAPASDGRSQHYPALDGLRGVAVTAVFICHYFYDKAHLRNGWVGVEIFFVLSGFLITGILFDSQSRPYRFRDFYVRRALRIMPLYYGVWLALLLTTPVFLWRWSPGWIMWPLHIGNIGRFFVHDPTGTNFEYLFGKRIFGRTYMFVTIVGHFWSLCIEEQFYAVWPAVVYFVRKRSALITICLFVITTQPLLRWFVATYATLSLGDHGFNYFATPVRLDGFMYGGLLALMLRGSREREWIKKQRKFVTGSIYVLCAIIAAKYFQTHKLLDNLDARFAILGLSAIDLCGFALVMDAIHPESRLSKVLTWKPLRWVGGLSYGVYVFHELIHPFCNELATLLHASYGVHDLVAASFGYPTTLLISYFSFRYYEVFFLKFKSRFNHQVHKLPID